MTQTMKDLGFEQPHPDAKQAFFQGHDNVTTVQTLLVSE